MVSDHHFGRSRHGTQSLFHEVNIWVSPKVPLKNAHAGTLRLDRDDPATETAENVRAHAKIGTYIETQIAGSKQAGIKAVQRCVNWSDGGKAFRETRAGDRLVRSTLLPSPAGFPNKEAKGIHLVKRLGIAAQKDNVGCDCVAVWRIALMQGAGIDKAE